MAMWQQSASMRMEKVCRFGLVVALVLLATPVFAANDPPVNKIELAPLGFPRRQASRGLSGAAMSTLNYVDSTHLLFTFTKHELLHRIPNDPSDDDDRNVAAILLELPSGKVLARTTWRLHDYSQYLWDIGDGRFLLRTGTGLTTIAPLANPEDPFVEQPMTKFESNLVIANIEVTFDRGVMVLEISEKQKPHAPGVRPELEPPVKIQFVRLLPPKDPKGPVPFRVDSTVERRGPTEFSLSAEGFMQVRRAGSSKWGFDFQQYDGKLKKLAILESSCPPFPVFVSPSEFVSFSCRGSEAKAALSGFNLKGELAWQTAFGEPQAYSTLSTAPQAGRFAISRGLGVGAFFAPNQPSQITTQEIRVIQSYDGVQLLRVTCSPVQATGQNFALSPDGMSLVVMQDALVFYKLPELSVTDKKALEAAKQIAPPLVEDAVVDLSKVPDIPPPAPLAPETAASGLMAATSDVPDEALPPPAETIGAAQPDETADHSPMVQHRPTIFVPQ